MGCVTFKSDLCTSTEKNPKTQDEIKRCEKEKQDLDRLERMSMKPTSFDRFDVGKE